MSDPQTLQALKSCELHVHTGGCLTAEDVFELGRDIYHRVDWSRFMTRYETAFGFRPDPKALFRAVLKNRETGMAQLKQHYIYGADEAGNFAHFLAKSSLAGCLAWHLLHVQPDDYAQITQRVLERHATEGLAYVEYRMVIGGPTTVDEALFQQFHYLNAAIMQTFSQTHPMTARYIISISRERPLVDYERVKNFLKTYPSLIPTVIGLDFCNVEEGYPPKNVRPLFEKVAQDNLENPKQALDIVYHVGESFFDKSLESAIRWCHEAAEMGAKRLGHAIALGLDAAIALERRKQAHEYELVSERLDQIAYDLEHIEALADYGLRLDRSALKSEQAHLQQNETTNRIHRPYTAERLLDLRQRQHFVLDCLPKLGTVIESCPTSNLRIGGVPNPAAHPIHRFLAAKVNLAVCSDDPGVFNSPLANEIAWVLQHSHLDGPALAERLGDPYHFRLGLSRK